MDIINKVFIPLSIRNYALLQGESMDRLVDLSSKKALSDTIDTLAGISILKGICDTSRKMAKWQTLYIKQKIRKTRRTIPLSKEKKQKEQL